MESFVKRLQLVRKKLLPLLLCMAVAGSQVPVMAADVGGFSDSAEGFDEEWAEDTQTQSAEAEDTTEIAEENTTENTGTPDEQTEDSAEAADGDTEDIALQNSGENTETPEISEKSHSDSQENDYQETVRRASGMTQTVMSPASNISRAARLRRKRSRNSWHPLII
jgi:hypothetical protein